MTSNGVLAPATEADQLRQQLLQAQRLCSVGALASSVAHEFNNILTTIINYAKLGLRPTADDAGPHPGPREDPQGQPAGRHHHQQHARLRPGQRHSPRARPTSPGWSRRC